LEWYNSEYGGRTNGPGKEATEVATDDVEPEDEEEEERGMGLDDRLTPDAAGPSGAGESALNGVPSDDGAGLLL